MAFHFAPFRQISQSGGIASRILSGKQNEYAHHALFPFHKGAAKQNNRRSSGLSFAPHLQFDRHKVAGCCQKFVLVI